MSEAYDDPPSKWTSILRNDLAQIEAERELYRKLVEDAVPFVQRVHFYELNGKMEKEIERWLTRATKAGIPVEKI